MSDDSSKDERLVILRDKILDALIPVISDGDMDPARKFSLLLATAQNGGSEDVLYRAFDVANQIEDNSEKANALLDLLDEIELRTTTPDIDEDSEEPQSDGAPQENENQ